MIFYSDYFKIVKFFKIFEKILKDLKIYYNNNSHHQHDTYMSVSDVNVSEFDENKSEKNTKFKKNFEQKSRLSISENSISNLNLSNEYDL